MAMTPKQKKTEEQAGESVDRRILRSISGFTSQRKTEISTAPFLSRVQTDTSLELNHV